MRSDDLVILYMGPGNVDFCYLSPESGAIFHNKFGAFHHSDFIGKAFGSCITARSGASKQKPGWLVALAPTPELWASCVRHRTQIVHQLDASVVCFELGIIPGSIVAEAGTGSAAMSTALARCCCPTGHLYTFEFNERRAMTAQQELERNGLSTFVTTSHADVCKAGFTGLEPSSVDAVFLDLPEPWLAVPHAYKVVKASARLASYSPCIEQAQRTCAALDALGVYDLKTLEARQRDFELRAVKLQPFSTASADATATTEEPPEYVVATPSSSMRGHTAFLTFATFPP